MQSLRGSVFNMTAEDLKWYTEHRLYPNKTLKGMYGCASLSGFLALGEDLLKCCEKDQKKLIEKKSPLK